MPRYLSADWFARLRELGGGAAAPGGPDGGLRLRHVVADAPDGDVTYDVVVGADRAGIDEHPSGDADLTFHTDYPTAAAIAAGVLSTQAALAAGRLSMSGDVTVLTGAAPLPVGADPLPPGLRAETEYR